MESVIALAGRDAPTAVLCATDCLAVGALRAIAAAGLRAGRDVSVIGYDDLPVATFTDPPLTSFDPMVDQAAERLVSMLRALLQGAPVQEAAPLIGARLIARASDGPAPAVVASRRLGSRRGGLVAHAARSDG